MASCHGQNSGRVSNSRPVLIASASSISRAASGSDLGSTTAMS
jgi:hypothetical protein